MRKTQRMLNNDYVEGREKSVNIKAKFAQVVKGRGNQAQRTALDILDADIAIHTEIMSHFQSGTLVKLTNRDAPGVIYYIHQKKRFNYKLDNNVTLEVKDNVEICLPRHKETGSRLKALSWMMACIEHGPLARAFNLNLSVKVIEAARNSPKGMAAYLRDKITRQLDRDLKPFGLTSPDLTFSVEIEKPGGEHLHGVIILPAEVSDRRVYRAIRNSLKRAGGDWNTKEHENQLRWKALYDAPRWGKYASKYDLISKQSAEGLTAATLGIRKAGKDWYENARDQGWNLPRISWAS